MPLAVHLVENRAPFSVRPHFPREKLTIQVENIFWGRYTLLLMKYKVLAYYLFKPIDDPLKEAERHKKFLETLDSKGRIYVGKDGVNAQCSVKDTDLEAYLDWLQGDPLYSDVPVKIHEWHEHPFAKLTVKMRKQLVAVDREVDLSKRGEYLTPKLWRETLENKDPDTLVIDVRNNYESDVGHFEGAIKPDIETFREFPEFARDLAQKCDPKKTKLMIYCTGGIRCEIYAPILIEQGFEKIYQLKGGVIQYGLDEGSKHWNGKLFVFDDRLVVPIANDKEETIATCHFCAKSADAYYNCANMDCNKLFTACPDCASAHKGCCSTACMSEGRVRAFSSDKYPKPFRKLPHNEKEALKKCELS